MKEEKDIIDNMINFAVSKLDDTNYNGWVDISRVLKQSQ